MDDELIELQFYTCKISKINRIIVERMNQQIPKCDNIVHFLLNTENPTIQNTKRQILVKMGINPDIQPSYNHNVEENINQKNHLQLALNNPEPIDDDNIKRIFKECAFRLHPDRPHGNKEAFQELNRAFEKGHIPSLIEIILKHKVQINIPKDYIKLLKKEYRELKRKKHIIKNNWINLWNNEWSVEQKLIFLEEIKID